MASYLDSDKIYIPYGGDGTGSVQYRQEGLDDWFRALYSATAAAPVDVVYIGDSLHALGTTYTPPVPGYVEQWLNFQLGVAGVSPLPIGVYGQADYSPTATTTAGTTSATSTGGFGSTLTNTQVLTHVVTCTSVSVVYRTDPSYGTLTVRDGAGGTVLGTIDCAAAARSGNIWTSAAISDGSHTIHITSTGTTRVEMVKPHYGHKVRVWNCAHSGYTSANYKDNSYLAFDLIDTLEAAGRLKLVIIATGANDDAAPYATVIPQLIAATKTHTTANLALWFPYICTAFPLSEYTAARPAAYATRLPVIDASVVTATAPGLDGTHPDLWQRQMIGTHETAVLGGDPLGVLIRQVYSPQRGTMLVPSSSGVGAELSTINILLAAFYGATGAGFSFGDGSAVFGDVNIARAGAKQLSISSSTGTLAGNINPSLNAQTGTTYTLVLADMGKTITRSNGSASTQTLPANAAVAIPIGTIINIINLGAGVVTFANDGTSTIAGTASIAQNVAARMIKISTNGWLMA